MGPRKLDPDEEVKLKLLPDPEDRGGAVLLEERKPGSLVAPAEVGSDGWRMRQYRDELFWQQVREDAAVEEQVRAAGEENALELFAGYEAVRDANQNGQDGSGEKGYRPDDGRRLGSTGVATGVATAGLPRESVVCFSGSHQALLSVH